MVIVMGRIKKASGLVAPSLLDLRIISLGNLDTGWRIPLTKLSEFAKLCISKDGSLSPEELNFWSASLDHDKYRLLSFIDLTLSIYREGYRHVFDYYDEHRNSGDLPDLPRVIENNLLDDGRHRVAVLQALGVSTLPVYLIRLDRVKRPHHMEGKWHAFRAESLQAAERFSYSREWYDYRRTSCYKNYSMIKPEEKIPRMYSRPMAKEKKRRRWFRRKRS